MKRLVNYEDKFIYVLDNDTNIGNDIKNGIGWESHIRKVFELILTKTSTLLDIGSNYGYHSIMVSHICSKIYSFEPQKVLYLLQLESIKRNEITNVKVYNSLVGSESGLKKLQSVDYSIPQNFGDITVGEDGEVVEVVTIDELEIENVDVIKIDVQGYEKLVLDGAIKTIRKQKPTLIIEIEEHQLIKHGFCSSDIVKTLKNLNYFIYQIESEYPSDYLCIHENRMEFFYDRCKNKISNVLEKNKINTTFECGVIEKIELK